MLEQGIQLLDRFCQDDRIRIRQPRRNLQIKFERPVSGKNDFVAYVDAIGNGHGTRSLIEWKTTSARYPEKPDGLLRTTITDEQRNEFGHLVADTIGRIESAQFLPHSGIRFPQNPCSTCPYLGLCLGKQEMVDTRLVRRPGAENLGWLDELAY
jgi:hypothetical protein